MTIKDTRKPSLDGILDSIRTDEPSREEIDAAADRIRASFGFSAAAAASSAHIENCAGFQALIPAFLAGALESRRALLLEDHSRECIPCRRALIAARTPRAVPAATAHPGRTRPSATRWLAAAALAAVAVLGAYMAWQAIPLLGGDPQLKVMRVDGTLYQLTAGTFVPLRPGMSVSAKSVRTAKDSGALVMLDDGSRVEMRDRTDLTVTKRRDGATVNLRGGAIIVEASPQGSGHLDVRTDDCLVAVKGTIFSVNTGTKGSRISVVEGAVRVAADGRESLLNPGDQMTTSDALTTVAVGEEIAWSKDAPRYVQLLHELASLRKDLDARVPNPALRYGSTLLDRMPDGTVVYAAIPNLTDSLVTAKKVFEEHVASSQALQAWWNQHMSAPEDRKNMDQAFDRLKAIGGQLGDEIVVALAQSPGGAVRGPILMAEVKNRAAFRATLAREMRGVQADASLKFEGRIARIEFGARRADAAGANRRWAESSFRAKLAEAYADGASWLFGADLKAMIAQAAEQARAQGEDVAQLTDHWGRIGLLDAAYLIFEHADGPDGASHRAEISFDAPRRGIAGWLASPAPMGAAEFVSPDAAFAAAAVVKRPEELLAEALSWIGPDEANLEAEGAIERLRGLAETMGGDIAIALDGPVLPVPSYKLVVEIYDPVRFQTELETLAGWINDRLASEGHEGRIVLTREDIGNRTDWVVRFTGPDAEGGSMRYTITDGYLVAAPSRALIDVAIEQRRNDYSLTRSTPFAELLPADGHVNVSSFVWEHLGPTVGPLAARFSGALGADDAKSLEAVAAESHPHLVTAYAEDDRIVINARGQGGLDSLLASFLSAHHLEALGEAMDRARHAEQPGGASHE